MATDLLVDLLRSGLAVSLATLAVLLLRRPLRPVLGARVGYALWMLPPMAALASLLPTAESPVLVPVVRAVRVSVPAAIGNAIASAPEAGSSSLLLVLWLLGVAAALSVFGWRQARFNRRIHRRQDRPWDEVVGHGPAVTGLWRQRIVLPADFGQRYSDAEQALVIAHEQTHLRRGDVHAQTLATALRCIFWFNPLLHVAVSRFRFDQELACDAAVLSRFPSSASRRSYGEAMLKTQMAEFGAPIGCHWQSCHPLKERIAMLKKPLPGALRRVSGSIVVAGLVFAGSLTAWAAQPTAHLAAQPAAQPAAQSTAKHVAAAASTDASFVSMDHPEYPASAIAKKQRGTVVLKLLVGADGSVKRVKIEKSSAVNVLDQAATDAAKKWTFHPATSNGKPVAGWIRVPVEFKA